MKFEPARHVFPPFPLVIHFLFSFLVLEQSKDSTFLNSMEDERLNNFLTSLFALSQSGCIDLCLVSRHFLCWLQINAREQTCQHVPTPHPATPRSLKKKAQYSFKKLISFVGNTLKEESPSIKKKKKSTGKGAPPKLVSASFPLPKAEKCLWASGPRLLPTPEALLAPSRSSPSPSPRLSERRTVMSQSGTISPQQENKKAGKVEYILL